MKLLSQPRLLESRVGHRWLSAGFRLFHRQPLAWTMILFMYWAAMLMMAFIPFAGSILPLILAPGLSLGFIEIARAIDERRSPSPPLLISAFRSPQAKAVLMLGGWYLAEILVILLISMVIDGGAMFAWITTGAVPTKEQLDSVQMAGFVSAALYIPVMMAFWFAPQLVVWSGFSPMKALFFSFFAVWRNKGAFLRYAITWIALTLFLGAVMALINESLQLGPNTMTAFLFPITLILMSVAHGSFYESTKAVFGDPEMDTATPENLSEDEYDGPR